MPITDALPNMKRELRFYPAKNDAPKKLTREQIQQFNEKGYIFPLDVFTKKEAEANRAPAVLCRGIDPSGYWQHIPRPDGDEIPDRK